jgi:hypothetical protein
MNPIYGFITVGVILWGFVKAVNFLLPGYRSLENRKKK